MGAGASVEVSAGGVPAAPVPRGKTLTAQQTEKLVVNTLSYQDVENYLVSCAADRSCLHAIIVVTPSGHFCCDGAFPS